MYSKIFQTSSSVMLAAALTGLALSPLSCTATQPETAPSPIAQGSMTKDSMMKASNGAFVSAEHTTTGSLQVVTEGQQRYLVLDSAFKTSSGPDLFVILHKAEKPESYPKESYVSLGKLQQISGMQRYAIPQEVNLNDYKSAVIWCRQFSATFGYAPLP